MMRAKNQDVLVIGHLKHFGSEKHPCREIKRTFCRFLNPLLYLLRPLNCGCFFEINNGQVNLSESPDNLRGSTINQLDG